MRKNLFLLQNGNLLYYVGAIGVIFDQVADTQRHYLEHNEDIECMDLHPNKELVVSGQKHVRLLQSNCLKTGKYCNCSYKLQTTFDCQIFFEDFDYLIFTK